MQLGQHRRRVIVESGVLAEAPEHPSGRLRGPSRREGALRQDAMGHGCVGHCHAAGVAEGQQHAAGEHEDRHKTLLLFDLWLPLPGGVGIQAGGDQFRPGLDRVLGISPLPLGGSLDRSAAGTAIHTSPEDLTSH